MPDTALPAPAAPADLAERLDNVLPQTQCTRCGYADCRAYAQAIASGAAGIDRCPPGGAEGIARLARITGLPAVPLDAACGSEGPLRLARIDEAACIGCTLCIQVCPVDCIIGAAKRMHTVIGDLCTGCELCLPACPVDCIEMVEASGARTGWAAWSGAQAAQARTRYQARTVRLERERREADERLSAAARVRGGGSAAAPGSGSAVRRAEPRAVAEAAPTPACGERETAP